MTIEKNYNQSQTYQSEAAKDLSFATSRLCLYCTQRFLAYIVVDAKDEVQAFRLEEISDLHGNEVDIVQNIIRSDTFLQQANFFDDITIAFSDQSFTLVPNDFVATENIAEFARQNFQTGNNSLLTEEIKNTGYSIVYASQNAIVRAFETAFQHQVNIKNSLASFVAGLLKEWYWNSLTLVANLEDNLLQLVAIDDKKIRWMQSYKVTSAADVFYYIMSVAQSVDFNIKQHPLYLWGDWQTQGEAYALCKKYFGNIHWGSRPQRYTYSKVLDALPQHAYVNLFLI
ncbi:MAG: DUF3822 family protein [Chitinophagales bacterium]|nr:DUF3822 family protein [Bacteroidota bacterium]MCB9042150.1 DUF3822 family protein [Chitinophagales bacterium]